MKKSDIYEITIKILGVYLLVSNLSKVPGFFTFLKTFSAISGSDHATEQMNLFWLNIINFVFIMALSIFLIAGTKLITRLVTNSADKQENVKLFADRKVIYEIALIIIGGLLIVNTVPDLLYRLYNIANENDQNAVISSITKVFVGILTVAFGKRIAVFFAK
ncbi:hypothetical protein [Mucilaginibacter ginsenosidivorax]|uniref:DUF2975 domain-containing protein n=1 Tax=Mucilaginibacter ginsenosidivorax TaxID=862126 RepID=A0A5B8W8P6_9SPHI|nr:hypothetical protein [Mucilaginibacter ginsenosidivorax]QEC80081.1 hypothetical protein FSB76_30535 [Mucilaginibacter ginsenosidivorax]